MSALTSLDDKRLAALGFLMSNATGHALERILNV